MGSTVVLFLVIVAVLVGRVRRRALDAARVSLPETLEHAWWLASRSAGVVA